MEHLIVGLGNAGSAYAGNRHNVGFMVLDALAEACGVYFREERLGTTVTFRTGGKHIRLLKPATYMNRSGRSVRYWQNKDRINTQHLLVISDDIALPLGRLRLRASGSCGGHNGLRSVEEHLGTSAYARLRVGVGRTFARGGQSAYVLENFSEKEKNCLRAVLASAREAVLSFCRDGIDKAMSLHNQRPPSAAEDA